YAVVTGVFTLATFAMHGSIYLYLKTEGDLQERIRGWIMRTFLFFVVMYVVTTLYTLIQYPKMISNFQSFWWIWVIVILKVMAIANIPRALYLGLPVRAFISSCCVIAALLFMFGVGIYPNMVVSSIDPAYNLTIYNSAS